MNGKLQVSIPPDRLGRDTKSMRERGIASADTIDGEKTGVHWKRQGEDKGKVLTMSMSDRGSLSLGYQNTEEPLMLLRLVSSTVNPDAPRHFVPKYTRNQADIADVLLANGFFKNSHSGSTGRRIREFKDAADKCDDKSHPFTSKPRSNSAPRATDKWNFSLHESVASVLKIAPNATEVNDADRVVSASSREGNAQRIKESRKRKP